RHVPPFRLWHGDVSLHQQRNSRANEAPPAGSTVSAKLTSETPPLRLTFTQHNRYLSPRFDSGDAGDAASSSACAFSGVRIGFLRRFSPGVRPRLEREPSQSVSGPRHRPLQRRPL